MVAAIFRHKALTNKALLALLVMAPCASATDGDFYKGKTINLIVSADAGQATIFMHEQSPATGHKRFQVRPIS